MLTYLLVVPVFLIMVTLLVAAHEYGHYLFARMNGMEVEEFAIGFGKKLCVWMRKRGTEFTIRALPLGGFVRIKGMLPEEDGSETQVENGFYSKSPLRRLSVLFAGPLFSVLAGFLVLTVYFSILGDNILTNKPVIGEMTADGAAYKAGMRPGDTVVSVDGHATKHWFDFQSYVRDQPGKPVKFEVSREGKLLDLTITPVPTKTPQVVIDQDLQPTGEKRILGMIGIFRPRETLHFTFPEALSRAAMEPVTMVSGLISTVAHPKSFSDNMAGPATIIAVTYEATSSGATQVIYIAALLSISLGILNLLPFPPMDGGQIMIAFAELFRRGKRLSIEIQNAVNTLGLALVSILILAVLWVDAKRWAFPDKSNEPPIGKVILAKPAK